MKWYQFSIQQQIVLAVLAAVLFNTWRMERNREIDTNAVFVLRYRLNRHQEQISDLELERMEEPSYQDWLGTVNEFERLRTRIESLQHLIRIEQRRVDELTREREQFKKMLAYITALEAKKEKE